MAQDGCTNRAGEHRQGSEIEAERPGQQTVHDFEVQGAEDRRGERHREGGTVAAHERALDRSPTQQFLGQAGRDGDAEQDPGVIGAGAAPQCGFETIEAGHRGQARALVQRIEAEAQAQQARRREREFGAGEARSAEPEVGSESAAESRGGQRERGEEGLHAEALEGQRARGGDPRRVGAGPQRGAEGASRGDDAQGCGSASIRHPLQHRPVGAQAAPIPRPVCEEGPEPERDRVDREGLHATLAAVSGSPLAPVLLVAMPQLSDPNFRRTVVLLVHHDDEGTFGVVLNRPTELSAMGLCSSLDLEWGGPASKGIDWGGPVQPQTGWLLMGEAPPEITEEIQELSEGLFFAGSLDVLRQVAEEPPSRLHLLLGYAGWGPGQLESELQQGAWVLVPADADTIFDVAPESMWDHALRSQGIDPSSLVPSPGVH